MARLAGGTLKRPDGHPADGGTRAELSALHDAPGTYVLYRFRCPECSEAAPKHKIIKKAGNPWKSGTKFAAGSISWPYGFMVPQKGSTQWTSIFGEQEIAAMSAIPWSGVAASRHTRNHTGFRGNLDALREV